MLRAPVGDQNDNGKAIKRRASMVACYLYIRTMHTFIRTVICEPSNCGKTKLISLLENPYGVREHVRLLEIAANNRNIDT